MFTTLIVQPIFNVFVLIYALLPGHNFGMTIIIFTILVRLAMWPLVKKQLHQTKAMRELQPELKRIKEATKGDRQRESVMVMALYKERKINPFSTFVILLIQLPILIGLYAGLHRVLNDPQQIVNFAYPFMRHLPWLQQLAANPSSFDSTLFGFIDLHRAAIGPGGIYWPAMIIVISGTIAQYYQSKQLLVTDSNSRSLRTILKEAGSGKQSDQGEVNAAVGRSTRYVLPFLIFLITVRLPAALSLYFLVSGLVAYAQQAYILRQDTEEGVAIADASAKKSPKIIEGEVVPNKPKTNPKKKAAKRKKKRR